MYISLLFNEYPGDTYNGYAIIAVVSIFSGHLFLSKSKYKLVKKYKHRL